MLSGLQSSSGGVEVYTGIGRDRRDDPYTHKSRRNREQLVRKKFPSRGSSERDVIAIYSHHAVDIHSLHIFNTKSQNQADRKLCRRGHA